MLSIVTARSTVSVPSLDTGCSGWYGALHAHLGTLSIHGSLQCLGALFIHGSLHYPVLSRSMARSVLPALSSTAARSPRTGPLIPYGPLFFNGPLKIYGSLSDNGTLMYGGSLSATRYPPGVRLALSYGALQIYGSPFAVLSYLSARSGSMALSPTMARS